MKSLLFMSVGLSTLDRLYAVFFYIIIAVLVKYHDVNNMHITALKTVSDITASSPCGCIT